MNIIILGCGRVGARLASMMEQAGHTVTVIDNNPDAFERLDPEFKGETVQGNGIDQEVLRRAGIEEAEAFIAVTNGDNRNIMASQLAKEIFDVKKVLCRIYDPIRESMYKKLGLETFCPTVVGADLMFKALSGKN